MALATHTNAPVLCCYRGTVDRAFMSPPTPQASSVRGFVKRPEWHDFQTTLTGLRELCPPAKPVIVRTSWLPDAILGQCVLRQSRFVIQLNRFLREPQAVEVLLHEWAHARAWNYSLESLRWRPDLDPDEFERACHDETWGCCYSAAYRTFREVCR